MSNLNTQISLPTRCISYYASDKSPIDGKHSYQYWMRSKLVRIVCNKPFSRGDVLEIQSIQDTTSGILITTILIDEWQEEYPVLSFVSGRLVYNKWANFKYLPSEGIQIIKPIEQVLNDNFSLGFVLLTYKSGKITCIDELTQNQFNIYIKLEWESTK